MKTREEIYKYIYEHMKFILLQDGDRRGMSDERFKAHCSHKANVYAVRHTERIYNEQSKD